MYVIQHLEREDIIAAPSTYYLPAVKQFALLPRLPTSDPCLGGRGRSLYQGRQGGLIQLRLQRESRCYHYDDPITFAEKSACGHFVRLLARNEAASRLLANFDKLLANFSYFTRDCI